MLDEWRLSVRCKVINKTLETPCNSIQSLTFQTPHGIIHLRAVFALKFTMFQKKLPPQKVVELMSLEKSAMETNMSTIDESAQPTGIADLQRKSKLTGTVLKTTLAGAVVDIGMETPGVVHISQLQEKPTNRVEDVVQVGQTVEVWVKRVDAKKGRLELTMIEPLALEWRDITPGMKLKGKVTRLEKFGVFVEVGAERPGLVHISEMTHDYIKTPGEVVKEGDEVEVQVLEINRRKKQIKLSMKALEEKPDVLVKAIQAPKPKEKTKTEEEATPEEPIPTAMEMALREAVERSKSREETPRIKKKQRASDSNQEIEKILSRTLENKVRTSK